MICTGVQEGDWNSRKFDIFNDAEYSRDCVPKKCTDGGVSMLEDFE